MSVAAPVGKILQILERDLLTPAAGAEEPAGLVAGAPDAPASGVLVATAVTPAVVAHAADRGAGLIVARRPLWRGPLRHIRSDTPAGALIEAIVRHSVSVFVGGSGLEEAVPGPADTLAARLGLQGVRLLEPLEHEPLCKLVVFVPQGHEDAVRAALAQAGAGHIGNYDSCAFETAGTGTFRPLEGTNPFIGATGQVERVPEVRLETIVPESRRDAAVAAMLAAHPYEEVAYDLIPLANAGRVRRARGRVGELSQAMSLRAFVESLVAAAGGRWRVRGRPETPVRRVAVCTGGGDRIVAAAGAAGADVVVGYGLDAALGCDDLPLPAVCADGSTARRLLVSDWVARIRARLAEEGIELPVWAEAEPGADEWFAGRPEGGFR